MFADVKQALRPFGILSALVLVGSGCARTGPAESAVTKPHLDLKATVEARTLRTYLDAFNRHDPAAVAAMLSPTVKWFSVDSDKLNLEGDGREAVRLWLTQYFQSQPDVRSEFLSLEQTGILVAVREEVTWTDASRARHRQQSHGVFQIRQGLITHVWYFPAARQP